MRNRVFWLSGLVLLVGLVIVFGQLESVKAQGSKQAAVYTPDVDLEKAPPKYRDRVIRFRNILRKQPTRQLKVQKAIELARKPKSEFRRDAVAFLGEVKAKEAVPTLIRLAKVQALRDEVLFSLGEINDKRAIPTLIHYMEDPNDNARGNAYRALQKITRVDFGDYADPKAQREQNVRMAKKWWDRMKDRFETVEENAEEKKSAEEVWDKYGRTYLHDLDR